MVDYCIYCGNDEKDGHIEACSLFSIREEGLKNFYFNSQFGRLNIIVQYTKHKKDKTIQKIIKRLNYESFAEQVRINTKATIYYQTKLSKSFFLTKWFYNWKYDKAFDKLSNLENEYEDYDLTKKEYKEIINNEKPLLYSTKITIPIFRNEKSKQLIYQQFE